MVLTRQHLAGALASHLGSDKWLFNLGFSVQFDTQQRLSSCGIHQVLRLPRETKVDVAKCTKCHAGHVKRRWLSPSATPLDVAKCERWCLKDSVWKMVVDKDVCERWWVTKMVCERWWVTKLCVKNDVWQSCVWKMMCDKVVVWQSCVWKMMCDKVVVWKRMRDKVVVWKMLCDKVVVWKMLCAKEAAEEAEAEVEEAGYRIKNKNPTQRCGERELRWVSSSVLNSPACARTSFAVWRFLWIVMFFWRGMMSFPIRKNDTRCGIQSLQSLEVKSYFWKQKVKRLEPLQGPRRVHLPPYRRKKKVKRLETSLALISDTSSNRAVEAFKQRRISVNPCPNVMLRAQDWTVQWALQVWLQWPGCENSLDSLDMSKHHLMLRVRRQPNISLIFEEKYVIWKNALNANVFFYNVFLFLCFVSFFKNFSVCICSLLSLFC